MSKYGNWTCDGQSWDTRHRGDIAAFNRWFTRGRKVWVVNEHSTKIAAQFEAHTCSLRTATGGGIFGGEGKALLECYGQVYETQPHGLRDIASPEPDCRDEGWGGLRRGEHLRGRLDPIELERVEGMARDASDRRDKRAAERGSKRGWF